MARAALQVGVRELAKMTGISAMTITRFENGHSGGQASTLRKIQLALEAHGIEFTNGDAPGVRLKTRQEPRNERQD
jgi:transcriptional regulator with XRE-family HTH domain